MLSRWRRLPPFLQSLCISIVFLLLALLIYDPRYETNDDVRMLMIASGQGVALEPDAHILFSHIAIGGLLSRLYSLWPGMPWYGMHLYLAQALAMTLLFFSVMKRIKGQEQASFLPWWVFVFMAIVVLRNILLLQYTTTASMLALGGWSLWGYSDRRWHYGLAGMALLWASMIRWEAFVLVTLLVLPMWIMEEGFSFFRFSLRNMRLWSLVICLVMALVLYIAHRMAYASDTEWGSFLCT